MEPVFSSQPPRYCRRHHDGMFRACALSSGLRAFIAVAAAVAAVVSPVRRGGRASILLKNRNPQSCRL